MKCAVCGNDNADNAQFCREYGASRNAFVTSGAGIGFPDLSMVNFPDAVCMLGFGLGGRLEFRFNEFITYK